MSEEIKLRMSGIEKRFPGVRALGNVDFSVRAGIELCSGNVGGRKPFFWAGFR